MTKSWSGELQADDYNHGSISTIRDLPSHHAVARSRPNQELLSRESPGEKVGAGKTANQVAADHVVTVQEDR